MNIAFFGGTFDPIHRGHIALARAALERYELGRVYFVPANMPPHRQQRAPKASYLDRYAMVALATIEEKAFVPSLLEAPGTETADSRDGKTRASKSTSAGANYSIDTVRRLKQSLKKGDRLLFLIGIDAFKDIAKWREPEALLRECEFIVASRPGYSLADVANSLPESMRPASAVTKPFAKHAATGDLVLNGATVHLLENVHQPASATAIREAVTAKRSSARFIDAKVGAYIKKMGLYRSG